MYICNVFHNERILNLLRESATIHNVGALFYCFYTKTRNSFQKLQIIC